MEANEITAEELTKWYNEKLSDFKNRSFIVDGKATMIDEETIDIEIIPCTSAKQITVNIGKMYPDNNISPEEFSKIIHGESENHKDFN